MTTAAQAGPFDDLLWQKRLLVVFPQEDAEKADLQRRMLARKDTKTRDLLVIKVPPSGAVDLPGRPPLDAAAVRRAYGIADAAPFTVLLIGKDGGVKLRSQEPVAARDLFGTIDAMPMRQREMKGG